MPDRVYPTHPADKHWTNWALTVMVGAFFLCCARHWGTYKRACCGLLLRLVSFYWACWFVGSSPDCHDSLTSMTNN